ncbi:AI-2E family transporter [Dongia sp.]|uniref:AI-2E family transporter n=1 Tax=Dongia sp. TaxID=1977262 RepID=UPI003752CC8E
MAQSAATLPSSPIPLGEPSPDAEGPRSAPVNLPAECKPEEPEEKKPESTAEALANAEKPLPTDPKTIYLGGLFALAVLVACYFAQAVIVPFVMAVVLKMMLQPLVRVMGRWNLPRAVGALAAMLVLAAVLVALGFLLSMPAASLGEAITQGLPRLEERLRFLQGPISDFQAFLTKAQEVAGGGNGENPVAIEKIGVFGFIFSGTRAAIEGLLTTGIILFFLMLSGDTFLRRGVEILPNFEHKRRAVEISQQVESDISVYLLTIISMNAIVGVAVGLAVWLCGVGDPVLWGALGFILNFVPIIGPITGMGLLILAGFMHFPTLGLALLPAGLYLLIHLIEGELVTPALLARRFTMNPVAVIVSIVFWYWMWGVPGAVLAVPMLAIVKIISDRIKPLMAFGHFLEGEEEGAAARYVARLTRRSAPAPVHKPD